MPTTNQKLFSQRNGYQKPSNVMIIGDVPYEVSCAISSALIRAMQSLDQWPVMGESIKGSDELGQYIWSHLMHRSIANYDLIFQHGREAINDWILSPNTEWYRKLDLVEFTISKLNIPGVHSKFIDELNEQFESLNFGYRILDGHVVDIVSKLELKAIDDAITQSSKAIGNHLSNALTLHTKRPKGDYANSIKESISAVEALLRQETGKTDFKDAVKALQKSGIRIQPRMETALIQMYAYTNQPSTGIRHPLMETESEHVPTSAESQFMLTCCSALVNFIREKKSQFKKRKNQQ